MLLSLADIAVYFAMGSLAGFLGGLIGIGGGFILVPGLYYTFTSLSLAPGNELPLALGTTMGCIIFTASSATLANLKHKSVRLDVVRRFAVWVAVGSAGGAALATGLDSQLVKIAFATFCLYSAYRMLFLPAPVTSDKVTVENSKLQVPGLFFGAVCGVIGIGGVNLFVPYLLKRAIGLKQAIATASVLQLPIAVIGVATYVILGSGKPQLPPYAVGYVYLPGLLFLVIGIVFFAPIGVKLAHRLPVAILKKIFGGVTAIAGLKMAGFFSLFSWL